ncbi:uncharacterized protein LOC130719643 [Lotus japonicus]|uniref:uncharacterized protein LOC130719643 n=1 Tax=Lotus japonicus TaxID=34305 RepID=UPI002588B6E2|nr:uncharacterized protein LOC130719643 [Lotus japonicus]
MRRLNLSPKWISLVQSCLEPSRVFVLVNGSPTDEFCMELGMRQGDPMAPFLFLIVAEGLNALLRQAVNLNLFSGYRFGNSEGEMVSILQYADDTLFIGEATRRNVFTVNSILRCFELSSDLKVNFNKSKLVGISMEDRELQVMANILNCRILDLPFSYLGLPVGGNPRRISFWDPVIAKLKCRLSNRRSNLSDARSGRASSWWKDIVISCCDPHDSWWFDEAISQQIRAGNSVRFWHDSWLGDDSLVARYSRLFLISAQPNHLVNQMGSWEDEPIGLESALGAPP